MGVSPVRHPAAAIANAGTGLRYDRRMTLANLAPTTARFDADGFAILSSLLTDTELASVDAALSARHGIGDRELLREPWCAALARRVQADARVAAMLPRSHRAVQCTSFEKSSERNWLVTLHQDVAIPVASRVAHPNCSGWSNKHGTWFVQPPDDVLAQLVAVRVHVDDCGPDDGALSVVAGSHRGGRLADEDVFALRDARGLTACPVARGGAMLMRPLLSHASSKATGTSRRRVLHFLFGPPALPCGLAWPPAR